MANTCFLNASVRHLEMADAFFQKCKSFVERVGGDNVPLESALQAVFESLRRQTGPVTLDKYTQELLVRTAVPSFEYNDGFQHDAAEVLEAILHTLDKSSKSSSLKHHAVVSSRTTMESVKKCRHCSDGLVTRLDEESQDCYQLVKVRFLSTNTEPNS